MALGKIYVELPLAQVVAQIVAQLVREGVTFEVKVDNSKWVIELKGGY